MRKIIVAVLLVCCLVVMSVSQAIRVLADAEMWFWGYPQVDPGGCPDNDGDGYHEAAHLSVGVRTTYPRYFCVKVYGRDEDGVQHYIYTTSQEMTEWNAEHGAYEYSGHTKLVVPFPDIWDFKLELYDDKYVQHDARDYGTQYLTNWELECPLIALVVRGEDNRIYYRFYDSVSSTYPGIWGAWNVVPTGATIDSPAATLLDVLGSFGWYPTLQIVVRGMDGNSLWHGYVNLTDNSFTGWDRIDGATNSRPTFHNNVLFVRGLDNHVYNCYYDTHDNTFGPWSMVDYYPPSGTTCDGPADAYILCTVVRGMDGNTLWYTSDTGWQLVGGATHSAPTMTDHWWPGKMATEAWMPSWCYLVVRGLDDSIYYRRYTDTNGWYPWGRWPDGATCDSPAAATIGYELHLVVRGMDGHSLWHEYFDGYGGVYSGWFELSGSTPSAPTLAS